VAARLIEEEERAAAATDAGAATAIEAPAGADAESVEAG